MKIFITNDDSIHATGLNSLIESALMVSDDVTVVAPSTPQSGKSSAITVEQPLRITRHENYKGAERYSVNGTPVDCVKLALSTVFKDKKPDILLSGINHGSNSATSVIYSGTMAAVIEGCMLSIKSIGFSLLDFSANPDFSLSRQFITDIIKKSLNIDFGPRIALNVNIPAKIIPKGIKFCRATNGYWTDEYKKYVDPFGRDFYMMTGHFVNEEPNADDTDEYFLNKGYASVVPVCTDMTAHDKINTLKNQFDI